MAQATLISQIIEQNESNQYYKDFTFDYSDRILREHNQETYEKIVKGLVGGNKVLFEQATGTGKSYLALKFLHDHAQGKRVLFVSPANAIKDSFTDLYNNWLGEDYCQFDTCLYQGLKGQQNKHYDIIIFDEVHRMGAKTWGPNAEILMNNNPNASVLGMTATLDRPDCVDVRKYFGNREPVSRITLVEALEKGILPKPDYTLAKVDFEDDVQYIDTCIKDFKEKLKQAKGEEKKQILEFLERLKKAKQAIAGSEDIPQIFANEITTKELKQGKFIVFCPVGEYEDENNESIHRMKTIMKQSAKWFKGVEGVKKIKKYSVYSKLGAKNNGKIIKAFEEDKTNSIKLLFSINMLNEGLHVDDIDGVIMLRSTGSRIIYLQQLGRALSVGHKQQPKIFDFVSNLNYVDVIAMQQMATDVNNSDNEGGYGRGYDDGDVNIAENNLRFKLNIDNLDTLQFIDNLKSNIFAFNHQNDFKFEDFLNRLLAYKKQYGDCLIPGAYNCQDGYPLGQKVSNIRAGNITLNEEQKQIITNVGFVWIVRGIDSDNVRMSIKQIVNDFNAFINKNGKKPRKLANPKTQEERDELNLVSRWKGLTSNSNDAEKDYIKANLIKVEEIRDFIVKVVQDVNAFINKNGKMPRLVANPKTQEEKDEYNLAIRWRRRDRNLNDAEKDYIEANLIKVEEKEEIRDWIVKVVQDVNAFINKNGKNPEYLRNPETQEERDELNLWRRWNRLARNSNGAEKDYMEANLIKVEEIRDSIVKVVQDVNAFINKNGKMPRQVSNPKTQEKKDEHNLAQRWDRLARNSNGAEKDYIEANLIKVEDKKETNINGGQEAETELGEINPEQ